jgi:sulfatase maturation enzyme AslB (radical SAM superfamily)
MFKAICENNLVASPVTPGRLALHEKRLGKHYDDLSELAAEAAATSIGADILLLEMTNICTFACLFCTQDAITRKKGRMSLEDARAAIDAFSEMSVGSLAFHVMGEPTLNADLPAVIEHTVRRHVRHALMTNASTLDREKAEVLFEKGLAHICLSVQTFSREQHDQLKRPAGKYTYEKTLENIRGILLAKWHKAPHAQFEIHVMDTSLYQPRDVSVVNNNRDAEEVLKFWSDFVSDAARESGLKDVMTKIQQTDQVELRLKSWPYGACRLAPDVVLTFKMAGHWQQDFLREDEFIVPVSKGTCMEIAYTSDRQLALLWNGDAVLCCFDYNGKTRFGNIHEAGFRGITERANRLREKLIRSDNLPFPVCRRCLGIRIRRFDRTAPYTASDGEIPLRRVAVYGAAEASVDTLRVLREGGIQVSGFVREAGRPLENNPMLEDHPVYSLNALPVKDFEALFFPPEWEKDEGLIHDLSHRYPDLLLGQLDLVALNPFDRPRIESHRKNRPDQDARP